MRYPKHFHQKLSPLTVEERWRFLLLMVTRIKPEVFRARRKGKKRTGAKPCDC